MFEADPNSNAGVILGHHKKHGMRNPYAPNHHFFDKLGISAAKATGRATWKGIKGTGNAISKYGPGLARGAWNANSAAVNSRAAGLMGRASGAVAGGMGKAFMTIPGGYMMLGLPLSAMTHDSTKNSFASHMSQEGLKLGADAAFETALFGTVGRMGAIGMGAALVGSVAMHALGANPGQMVQKYLDSASRTYKKKQGMGPTPIKQNQRTMQSTQRALSMLGRSTNHSMLGHEAQFMHN
jgi:hypothetical protein